MAGAGAGGPRSRASPGSKSSERTLSVIVPTYNETENIRPLCERLFRATKDAGIAAELVVVDDESSGSGETAKIVHELHTEGHAVRIHCRKRYEGRGLSSAVLLGFQKAAHSTILCMDADLQHPPESVPDVARPVLEDEAEFSVGSRHAEGGGVGFEWSLSRRIISKGATMLAWPLATASDPMSGFFCTTKQVLERGEGRINPVGFKICLEIMVRCRCRPICEVGFTFQERASGESKLDARTSARYLEQLAHLYWERFGLLLVALLGLALLLLARLFLLS